MCCVSTCLMIFIRPVLLCRKASYFSWSPALIIAMFVDYCLPLPLLSAIAVIYLYPSAEMFWRTIIATSPSRLPLMEIFLSWFVRICVLFLSGGGEQFTLVRTVSLPPPTLAKSGTLLWLYDSWDWPNLRVVYFQAAAFALSPGFTALPACECALFVADHHPWVERTSHRTFRPTMAVRQGLSRVSYPCRLTFLLRSYCMCRCGE